MNKPIRACWARMSDADFVRAWIAEVGEPPAVMLDRHAMIELLLDHARSAAEAGPGPDCARKRS